jgi:hypothetical protein
VFKGIEVEGWVSDVLLTPFTANRKTGCGVGCNLPAMLKDMLAALRALIFIFS